MNYPEIKIKNQLCHPLYSASNALQRIYKPLLDKINLTYPEYLVMMTLWESNEINITQISEATYFDSGTLTPLIKHLQKKEFISIKELSTDRRQKIISLTKKGDKLKEKAREIPKELICFFNLTQDEFKALKKLTEKLYTQIKEHEVMGK